MLPLILERKPTFDKTNVLKKMEQMFPLLPIVTFLIHMCSVNNVICVVIISFSSMWIFPKQSSLAEAQLCQTSKMDLSATNYFRKKFHLRCLTGTA